MAEPAVQVEGLGKRFEVAERGAGLRAALRALVHRRVRVVEAVRELSFALAPGERVGLLGPNGAGKTTTLKILAGLLYPSRGQVRVAGFTPHLRKYEFLRSISLVMGHKRQLSWDLPAVDTFELNRVIYDIDASAYRRRLDDFVERLGLASIMFKPVRQLSLGERMKCELVAALLHEPSILFLDEPTLGMDVSMQLAIRAFVREYNEERGATIVLTSHYMQDVSALCPRILVINDGALRFDGTIEALTRTIRPLRRVSVRAESFPEDAALADWGRVIERAGDRLVLDVEPERVPEVVSRLVGLPDSRELLVREAPLEEVLRELFARPDDADEARP
ncbi:MAG: ATP-binding cassette domain-containing protein [Myxococcales bacterium]|nr:ATP-binding cassette domain-containing protein [Myxococcales bacterium]